MNHLQEVLKIKKKLEDVLYGRLPWDESNAILAAARETVSKAQEKLDAKFLDSARELVDKVERKKLKEEQDQLKRNEELKSQLKAKAVERVERELSLIKDLNRIHPPLPILGSADLNLAESWASSFGGTGYWKSAMMSARRAELAGVSVYAELYGQVEDLAIHQLDNSGNNLWKLADIQVGDVLIDVKNARRSYSSQDSYSEHCVPRFKLDRDGKDVVISGFLSPYVQVEKEYATANSPIVWLGEVRHSEIKCLSKSFHSEHFYPDLRKGDYGELLQNWLFEYPSRYYELRNSRLKAIVNKQDIYSDTELFEKCGFDLEPVSAVREEVMNDSEAVLLNNRIQLYGPSRPLLFLHILDRFCRYHIDNVPFPTARYQEILFSPTSSWNNPIALCDPLLAIHSLLQILDSASKFMRNERFVHFYLSAPGVFRGKYDSGRWQTIIAYCGGWKQLENGKKVRCGKNPIVLGKNQPCTECGYLICDQCGFCKQACPGQSSRGARIESRPPPSAAQTPPPEARGR